MKSVTKAEQEDIFSLLEAVETSSRAFLCFSRISSRSSSDIQRRDWDARQCSKNRVIEHYHVANDPNKATQRLASRGPERDKHPTLSLELQVTATRLSSCRALAG